MLAIPFEDVAGQVTITMPIDNPVPSLFIVNVPGQVGSEKSDNGSTNTAELSAFAAKHHMPAVQEKPDNLSGEIESAEPTKGEGASGPHDYPHAGPPPGTTSAGVAGVHHRPGRRPNASSYE